jgi:hypothetical protein
LCGYNIEVALNSFESHRKSFHSFGLLKDTWSYHTLSLFRSVNRDLDKLTLAYFGPVAPLCLGMDILGLKDTAIVLASSSYDSNSSCAKLSYGLVPTSWWAHPNCNLLLNCACSSKHFLRQKLQDGKHISSMKSAKDLCVSFIRTDGILVEVRNQKERCYGRILLATTSHILALSLWLL